MEKYVWGKNASPSFYYYGCGFMDLKLSDRFLHLFHDVQTEVIETKDGRKLKVLIVEQLDKDDMVV